MHKMPGRCASKSLQWVHEMRNRTCKNAFYKAMITGVASVHADFTKDVVQDLRPGCKDFQGIAVKVIFARPLSTAFGLKRKIC